MIDQLRKLQLEIATGLCDHPAVTFQDYLSRVGEYRGLGRAIDLLSEEMSKEREAEMRR